ncbi:hypothetical protein ACFW6S_31690 [Streptomyces sp. NPDC058740]|uniref:hypothetical protein n=1 Tax=Streptomyces sp. NPDC058740 TaxID=3346619 RepID=UPI0036AA3E0A
MERDPYPQDLIRTQQAWTATYAALGASGSDNTTVRRRLLRLSVALWWHSYWTASGVGPGARVRLRGLARAGQSGQETRVGAA